MLRYQTEESETKLKSLQLPSIKQCHTVIGASELEQIRSHMSINESKSKKTLDNNQRIWALRIEKQRSQKEKGKFDKFQIEEEDKRKMDKVETEYQEKIKQEQVVDANNKIFSQRGDVRNMKSKMLMSENEKINDALVRFNKERQEIHNTLEVERLKDIEMKRQFEEQVQLEKTQQKDILKKETYAVIAKQHNEMKEKYFKEFTKLQQEGQLIKRQAEEEEQEKEKKKEEEKLKKQRLLAEREKFMDVKQSIQDEEQKLLDKEAKDRDHFDIKKDRVLEMRKQREAQKLERQMKLKQKIYDMRVVQLKEQEDNYMQRVQKHAEELQRHEEEVARQKELEIIQMIKEGETFRQRQLKLKETVKEKEEVDVKKEQVLKINALQQLTVIEEQQKEILRKRNKELLDYQKIQIEQKKLARRDQYMNELKESKQIELNAQQDRDIFMNWAKQQVEETREQGLNLYPLMKTLKL